MDRAAAIATLERALADAPREVIAAYLFGSVARGEAQPASDVDLAVLHRRPPPATLDSGVFDLEADLAARLSLPVQVVVLNGAPVDLVHRVLRDGIVLLDRDRAARIRFEVKARSEYFDLAPILARYRRTGALTS